MEVGHRPVRGVAGGVVLAAPALAGAIVGADLVAVVEQRTREGVVAPRLQRRVVDEGREPGFERHGKVGLVSGQEFRKAFAIRSAGTWVVGTFLATGGALEKPPANARQKTRIGRPGPAPRRACSCRAPCAARRREGRGRCRSDLRRGARCARRPPGSLKTRIPYFFGCRPIGLWTVAAKRCQNADWMHPASNSCRTRSSASTVSCSVSVGKPYIR